LKYLSLQFIALGYLFFKTFNLYGADTRKDLRVAIPNPIMNTDPDKVTIAQERFIIPLLYEGLFKLNEDGAIEPALAKSWKFDPVSKTLIIEIENQSRFSDGTPVTVDDVAKSFQILCSESSKIRDLLEDLEGCTNPTISKPLFITDPKNHSVSFRLKYQPTSFLYRLASHPVLIFKRTTTGRTIGSGPYEMEDLNSTQLSIIPNKAIANTSRSGKHKRIIFIYKKESHISEDLQGKEFDLAAMYLSSTGQRITNAAYKKYYHSPTVTQTLVLNPNEGAFAEIATRQRIRDRLNELKISSCNPGTNAAYGFIPPGVGGSLTDVNSIKQDPPKIPKIRKWNSVTIYEHKDRKSPCEEAIILKALAEVQIKANFQYEPSYKEMGPRRGAPSTPAYVELFVFPSRDAGTVLRRFLPGTKEPYFFYTKNLYQNLLHEAMNRPNLSDRFEIYRKINQDIVNESIVIPLYYVGHVNFVKSCLSIDGDPLGIFISPNSFSYLEKIKRGEECS